ncbi:MAG TPA: isochorismatase family protein, partial [Acidimicrobiales bacterium]|nr:isochorismatase family protein [Acidimicrobiales bacterium]
MLIDYQPEQFGGIRSETPQDLIELNTRWLVRAAKAFGVPIVLSTVGVGSGRLSPTQPAVAAELEGIEPIDRSSMNAFEDQAFRDAVAATGRRRLIFGALQTEVCLTFAVIEALKAGYEAQFVADAVGGRSEVAHLTGIKRMSLAGAVPNTTLAVVMEWFRDWGGPLADAARAVTVWYLGEVPKVTDTVGIAENEAALARAAMA